MTGQKNTVINILKYLGIALIYFMALLSFVNATWFESDELDIMLLGKGIARGQLLYTDLTSQHMPFSYYISALFYKFGAVTVTQQRIYFYAFFAVIWTLMYIRYKDLMGKYVMFFYPLLFCCIIPTYDLGTTIVSEHLAEPGLVILLLEYVRYLKTREVGWKESAILSGAVVLSFGTIFVAVFAVFVIAVGVLIKEIEWYRERSEKNKGFLKYIISKYIRLIFSVAIPWIILCIYYIINSTFKAFVFSAYIFNREIYSQYAGGYGESIVAAVLGNLANGVSLLVNSCIQNEYTNISVMYLIIVCCITVFMIKMFGKYGKTAGIIILLFVIFSGSRGYFRFHGTQFVGIAAFMTSWVIVNVVIQKKEIFCQRRIASQVAIVLLCVCMLSGFTTNLSRIGQMKFTEEKDFDTQVVEVIAERNDVLWQTSLSLHIAMQADRIIIGSAVVTPWTWQGLGADSFAVVRERRPKVAIFNSEHNVWGYVQNEFAPEAVDYLQKNYTKIEGTSYVYVRNDYYMEACEKVKAIQ